MDWRVTLGLTLTTVWIGTGLIYLLSIVGIGNFVMLPTADIGSFLEGAFAPLAFLWLVIGHFMQQKEITANTTAIKLQEESARKMELHSRRDSYFKLMSLVNDQLGAISAFHFISVCGPTGNGEMTSEEFAELRGVASTSDNALFVRRMISLAINNREDPAALHDIFYGTEIRSRHSENYWTTFNKLLDAAKDVDTDEMLTDALLNGSAQGLLFRIISMVKEDESIAPFLGAAPLYKAREASGEPA